MGLYDELTCRASDSDGRCRWCDGAVNSSGLLICRYFLGTASFTKKWPITQTR